MARKRSTASPSGHTILVIDDQECMLISLRLLLEREGHTVLTARSGRDGLALFQQKHAQLVIVDYRMPEMNGAAVIQELRRRGAAVPILLQSGDTNEQEPRALLRCLEIQRFHDKADGPERLLEWVRALLPRIPPQKQEEESKANLRGIVKNYLAIPPCGQMTTGVALAA